MGRYKVLVVGDDVADQLARFDENLAVDPYPDPDFDPTLDAQYARKAHESQGIDTAAMSDREVLKDRVDGELRYNAAGVLELWTTSNPEAKWDWWSVGGPWEESFLLKPDLGGRWVSSALVCEIDFDGMTAVARNKAEDEWARMLLATAGLMPPAADFTSYLLRFGGDSKAARTAWVSHPWVKATAALGYADRAYGHFFMGTEDPHRSFITSAEQQVFAGFADIVAEREWHSPSTSSWADPEFEDWVSFTRSLIIAADPLTRLTVVSCHL